MTRADRLSSLMTGHFLLPGTKDKWLHLEAGTAQGLPGAQRHKKLSCSNSFRFLFGVLASPHSFH